MQTDIVVITKVYFLHKFKGNCAGGPASDKANFALLLKELSAAFKPKGLLLSAAVGAGKSTVDNAYDIPKLSQYLDFINVMTYDFHGSWEKQTWHHSPLYSGDYKNTVCKGLQNRLLLFKYKVIDIFVTIIKLLVSST